MTAFLILAASLGFGMMVMHLLTTLLAYGAVAMVVALAIWGFIKSRQEP